MKNNSSFTSIEKIYFNKNNDKYENITLIKLSKNENNSLSFKLIKNEKRDYKIESINDFLNKEQEYIDDSIFNSNSDFNSFTNINVNYNRGNNLKESTIYEIIDFIKNKNLKNMEKSISLSFNNFDENNSFVSKKFDGSSKEIMENFLQLLNDNFINQYDCSICLNKFDEESEIFIINKCLHIFHKECLEKWINFEELNKNNCPYCKINFN